LQGVAGVENILHRPHPVLFLALEDKVAGKDHVVDDAVGIGPLAEQVVALEEGVVAVAGVGDDQGLHGHGVVLHQIGDAGVGIDHGLVGQALLAAAVGLAVGDKLLAKAPVGVTDGQPGVGIGVEHLFRGDDFDLVGKGVEAKLPVGDVGDGLVIGLQQV